MSINRTTGLGKTQNYQQRKNTAMSTFLGLYIPPSVLFSLGCYSGEPITVISRRRGGCIVSIKDGRYSIDNQLAAAISIKEK